MQIQWTDLAANDLNQIEAYIARENSPDVTINLVLQVINTAELVLASHPNAGRLGRVKETRELVIAGVPFVLIYRYLPGSQQLQILRVLHNAQQWPAAN